MKFKVVLFLSIYWWASLVGAYNFRGNPDVMSFGVLGDAGIRNQNTDYLRTILLQNGLTKLLVLGDNLYETKDNYPNVWSPWRQQGFEFTMLAIGNHNSGYANEVAYFQTPGEYYYKVINDILFIVLNSDNKNNPSEQIVWLDKVLSASTYKMNFIMYHHPTITLSDTHKWEERKDFQIGMRKIIKKHSNKISAILNGHDHSAGFFLLDTVPLILSGASFEQRKLAVKKDADFNVTAGWGSKEGLWWTKLDINPKTQEAWIYFTRFDKPTNQTCSIRFMPKPAMRTRSCN